MQQNEKEMRIFDVIREYQMIEPGMKIIAGVSGGADSVCLLYVLSQYRKAVPFELRAVHVEHGIRGQESLEDAAFTEQLCQKFQVECHTVSVDVERIARERGISVEEAGRMERYRIFEEIRSRYEADRIAVAHNQNDQAETVLWNLVRGSGLKGLGGIRPIRENVIRPLLFTGRSEIEEILREAGITWRTDRTNLETEYTRNRIRLSLLPQIEHELNRQAVRHIAGTAVRMQEMQAYLERTTERAAENCIRQEKKTCILILESWKQEDPVIRRELLRRVLELTGGLKDVGAVHVKQLEQLTQNDCGKKCDLPGNIRAVREDGILKVYRREETDSVQEFCQGALPFMNRGEAKQVVLPIPGIVRIDGWQISTEIIPNSAQLQTQIAEENKYTKWLSYDTIIDSVCLRTRKTGDYLVINTQGGRKKLKDYFINLKIPAEQRDRIWLFADGSHILWVPGCRISMASRVSAQTRQVLKIQMKEEIK